MFALQFVLLKSDFHLYVQQYLTFAKISNNRGEEQALCHTIRQLKQLYDFRVKNRKVVCLSPTRYPSDLGLIILSGGLVCLVLRHAK